MLSTSKLPGDLLAGATSLAKRSFFVHVLLVTMQVQPEHREAFMTAMLDDARGSVADEPGCLRFDVLQDTQDPNTIYLYEVYRDQAAFNAHLQAPHFIRWRDTVKDWYAAPSRVATCTNVFPPDNAWVKPPIQHG